MNANFDIKEYYIPFPRKFFKKGGRSTYYHPGFLFPIFLGFVKYLWFFFVCGGFLTIAGRGRMGLSCISWKVTILSLEMLGSGLR